MMHPEATSAAQTRHCNVTSGLELTVGLDADAPAQIVHHQNLLRLGEAEFPRRARVLNRLQR
jgi:hypothetical protein